MSKQMSVFFIVSDTDAVCRQLSAVIKMCTDAEYDAFSLNYSFEGYKGNIKKSLKQLFQTEKKLNISCCSVRKTLSFKYEQSPNIRWLAKNNCQVKILFDNLEALNGKTSRQFKNAQLIVKCDTLPELNRIPKVLYNTSIRFNTTENTESRFGNLFDQWLTLKDAPAISNFIDILNLILLKEHNECENSSCLGHVLSIDGSNIIHWCKYNLTESALCHVNQLSTLSECFSNNLFEKYLDANIMKRDYCKTECKLFDVCQGGCPLRSDIQSAQNNHCTEQTFIELARYVNNSLKKQISLGDLTVFNNKARAIILKALAYKPFSDIFTLEDCM